MARLSLAVALLVCIFQPVRACPAVVYTEGFFDMADASTGTNPRDCAIIFEAPKGSIVSFSWTTFSLDACGSGEYVVAKDGMDAHEANVLGNFCGTTIPDPIMFTGHTARLELSMTDSLSTFKIWVNHHPNHLTFELPESPSYALGSDIAIPFSMGLDLPVTRDSGWIGLYRDGTCETGSGPGAHECHLATMTVGPKQTSGEARFYFSQYKEVGWYDLRYFAGDASGTTCGVQDGQTFSTTNDCGIIEAVFQDANSTHCAYWGGSVSITCGSNTYTVTNDQGCDTLPETLDCDGTDSVEVVYSMTEEDVSFSLIRQTNGDNVAACANNGTSNSNCISGSASYSCDMNPVTQVGDSWCEFEPITTARIYITDSSFSYTQSTRAAQLPGFEFVLTH